MPHTRLEVGLGDESRVENRNRTHTHAQIGILPYYLLGSAYVLYEGLVNRGRVYALLSIISIRYMAILDTGF